MSYSAILLVEDNVYDEELTRRSLEGSAFADALSVCRNGADALSVLGITPEASSAEPHLPDLILLDLHLPKVSGLRVLESLRAHPRTRHIPVIVLLSSADEPDIERARMLGASGFIRKPLTAIGLHAAVSELGAEAGESKPAPSCP